VAKKKCFLGVMGKKIAFGVGARWGGEGFVRGEAKGLEMLS
jgi:hypothetical protein